jgi:hypothetical protein
VHVAAAQRASPSSGACYQSNIPLSSSCRGDLGRTRDLTAHMVAAVHLIMALARWGWWGGMYATACGKYGQKRVS